MEKRNEYKEIPTNRLVISRHQVRTRDVEEGLGDLAASIAKLGVLEPILVHRPHPRATTYEILAGQRRYLAAQQAGLDTLPAIVLGADLDDVQATAIGLAENLERRAPKQADLIDAVTRLYQHYGSVPAVSEATGLPARVVRQYTRYPRLPDVLRELVDSGIDVATVVRAADTLLPPASEEPTPELVEDAARLAREMASGTREQARSLARWARKEGVDAAIERALEAPAVRSLSLTVDQEILDALTRAARERRSSVDALGTDVLRTWLATEGWIRPASKPPSVNPTDRPKSSSRRETSAR